MICSRPHSYGQLRFAPSLRPGRFGTKPTQRREGAGVQRKPKPGGSDACANGAGGKGEQEFEIREQGI